MSATGRVIKRLTLSRTVQPLRTHAMTKTAAATAMLLLCLIGCPTTRAVASGADYASELQAWREQRARDLVREDGWIALVALHWLDPAEATTLGSASGNTLVIDGLPPTLGTIRHVPAAGWQIVPAPGQVLAVGNLEFREPVTLLGAERDDAAAARVPVKVTAGGIRFVLIERAGRIGLRVWDADAPARTGFGGLSWFDPDPSWRVVARWMPHPPGRTIDIANVIGMLEPMASPGAAVFERDGVSYRLEALQEPGSEELFFMFADRTGRRETYGAGRYLYTAAAAADADVVVLDFNRAFNPPCAYTAFATCPLPPPQNRLDLAVRAGERKPAPAAEP